MKRYRSVWWQMGAGWLFLIFGGMLLASCSAEEQATVYEATTKPLELTAWLPDWHWEAAAADELELTDRLARLYAFGVYFDSEDRLLVNDTFAAAWEALAAGAYAQRREDLHLTFVNDRILADGASLQKEPELVHRLVSTPEGRQRHVADILQLVRELDAGGAEIDYERIQPGTWEPLLVFIEELYAALKEDGRSLRVVLEPRTPLGELQLPEGPEYVMMAYNLYGSHSGPGPKADEVLIRRLARDMAQVPGEPVLALAAGGFDWGPDGTSAGLTEQQAHALAEAEGIAQERDPASAALSFTYAGEDGTHTVWYADGETFSQWIEWARVEGIDRIALWRLGGWRTDTLHQLKLF